MPSDITYVSTADLEQAGESSHDASVNAVQTRRAVPRRPGASHATCYAFGAARVDVESSSADAGRWLEEFLTPWMATTRTGAADVVVRFDSSLDAFAALRLQRATTPTRLVPCFALDRRVVTLPGWNDGDAIVVADDEIDCGYRVTRDRIDVVAPPDARRARIGLMRVVRERLTSVSASIETCLDLHAAAFDVGGRAVIVAGPRRAGKTSLLCHALASGRTGLIANDRVVVRLDGDEATTAHGVPTLVAIRPATLSSFPMLRIAPDERPALRHATEAEDDAANAPASERDFSLSPRQLAARLGAPCVAHTPISAVVFPEIVDDESTWTTDTVSEIEGRARLAACVYGSRHQAVRTIIASIGGVAPDAAPADDRTRGFVARLAASARLVRLRLGRRAYDRPAGAWLDAIETA